MGRYRAEAGASDCTACPEGLVQRATGQAECIEEVRDPIRCWKVKDLKQPKFAKIVGVGVRDDYEDSVVDVRGPAFVCAASDLREPALDPSSRQCCYKISGKNLPKPRPQIEIAGDDLGAYRFEVIKAQFLCEPCTENFVP